MAYIGRTLSDFRYPTHMSYTDDTQPLLLKIWDWTVASHFGYGESLAFADIAPRDAIIISFQYQLFYENHHRLHR